GPNHWALETNSRRHESRSSRAGPPLAHNEPTCRRRQVLGPLHGLATTKNRRRYISLRFHEHQLQPRDFILCMREVTTRRRRLEKRTLPCRALRALSVFAQRIQATHARRHVLLFYRFVHVGPSRVNTPVGSKINSRISFTTRST